MESCEPLTCVSYLGSHVYMEEKFFKNEGCINFYNVLKDQVGLGTFIF